MKITMRKDDDTETYFYGGKKKYEHSRNSTGVDAWREFDERGNEIHCRHSTGFERLSKDHPDSPKSKEVEIDEAEIKPFVFEARP